MLGNKIINYIKDNAPELFRANIMVRGEPLLFFDYDRINGFIIRNNLASENQEDLAIFNPPSLYNNLSFLVSAGLGCYKVSSSKTTLSEQDLAPGKLFFYEGRLVKFEGWEDSTTGRAIILANEDKVKTKSFVPISEISAITKYSGARTVPDIAWARTRTPFLEKTLGELLMLTQGQRIQFADYPRMIVCLPENPLIEILKETRINNVPFFQLFASVKWTPENQFRLSRDLQKRSPIFYFVGSLSAADDLLRSSEGARISGIVCSGERAGRSIPLLSSMRSNYPLKKIFILDQISSFELMGSLEKLGFDIWTWTPEDFKDQNFKTEEIDVKEVPYPLEFPAQLHKEIQQSILDLCLLSRSNKSGLLQAIIMSAYGLNYNLFQTPLPLSLISSEAVAGALKQSEDVALKALMMKGQVSSEAYIVIDRLAGLLKQGVSVFSHDKSKYDLLLSQVKRIPRTFVIVRRANLIEPLRTQMESDLGGNFYNIISSPKQIPINCENIIWTFPPNLYKYAEAAMKGKNTMFIGYPLQISEMEATKNKYNQTISVFAGTQRRAKMLKVDPELFDAAPSLPAINLSSDQAKIEELLLASSAFISLCKQNIKEDAPLISAKQVIFLGGFTAFFEQDHSVKVISTDGENIEQKNIGELERGDKVVFLKNERNSIFDELVDYYGHKPQVVEMLKLAETWRTALREYRESKNLTLPQLYSILKDAGIERTEATIDNWLTGKVICPPEENYRSVDIIAQITNSAFLLKNCNRVKEAAKKVHAMRVRIGRYLAKRIIQSAASIENLESDPVLADKLEQASSYAEIAEVVAVYPDNVNIAPSLANRLLGVEDF